MQIAMTAGKGQIHCVIITTVFDWYDVLNVEAKIRIVVLMDETILTPITCPLPNEVT